MTSAKSRRPDPWSAFQMALLEYQGAILRREEPACIVVDPMSGHAAFPCTAYPHTKERPRHIHVYAWRDD